MEVPKEEFRIIDASNGYRIVSMGKVKRRMSRERKEVFNKFVKYLEKTFQQSIHSVYINENLNNRLELYSINFVFRRDQNGKN